MPRCLSLLLLIAIFFSSCSLEARKAYRDLLETYRTTQALENQVFERLVFRPSERGLDKSINFKFVVEDQLKREWLFKAGPAAAEYGAVAIYELFQLFGLETPEIHPKTFQVNGQPVSGSLQRFLPNLGTVEKLKFLDMSFLNPDGQRYMAKNHVMSWLLLNHQVYGEQFLVLEPNAEHPSNVMRIDNAVEWMLLGHDRLDADYVSPYLWDRAGAGYWPFWLTYRRNHLVKNQNLRARIEKDIQEDPNFLERVFSNQKMDLNLVQIYEWALFVSGFPDEAFLDFFRAGIENNLRQFSNAPDTYHWITTPEIMLNADRGSFPHLLLERKRKLPKDLASFYEKLTSSIGEPLNLPSRPNHTAIAAELIMKLQARSRQLTEEARELDRLPTEQQPNISLPVSYKGFLLLERISKLHNLPKSLWPKIIEKLSLRLEELRKKVQNPNEIEAITNAQKNLEALVFCMNEPKFNVSQVINLNRFFKPNWFRSRSGHCLLDTASRDSKPLRR